MYSVVLATVLTAGTAQPGWWLHGCHGCHGCYSCYGCWSCYGCHGCYSCYGCWSCYGCYGCYSCYGSCFSCYGSCYGCYGSCYGCYGSCYGGCCGGIAYAAPAEKLRAPAKADAGGGRATVLVAAPPDGDLYIDGQKTPPGTRTFVTPPLDPGRQYYYTLKVGNDERRVIVEAGQTARVTFADQAAPAAAVAARPSQAAPAQLRVKLPAEAKLYIDGQQVPLTSSVRSFATPSLQPGRSYYYTMKAELLRDGQTVAEQKRVVVEAGKQVEVNFDTLGQVKTASR